MHAEDPSMSSHQVNGYAGYANGHSNLKYRTREVNGNAGPKGDGDHVPHPFIYRLYPTTLDKVIWLVMCVTLVAPIKLVLTLTFIVLAWIPAQLAVIGWPIDSAVPFPPWRLFLKDISVAFVRCAWFSAGITSQTVIGKQASSKDAPVIVMGPHTTFVDTLGGACCGFPGVVSVIENARLPFIGTLFRVNQSIFVERTDPSSRSKAATEIRRRAEAGGSWPQLVIFPEGTCCNGKSLLPYKPGAFLPGVSVQPVLIRYRNRLDTTSWLNCGPGLVALFTLLLVTPMTRFEIEFLPPYHPNEAEKKDPELYMRNVRELIARELGIPLAQLGYKDLLELVKQTRPKRGVMNLWKNIITKGHVEMPSQSQLH